MLGWEYPPHISGGLGTACEGLTKGLARLGGYEIIFVVPHLYGGEDAPHMSLIDSLDALTSEGRRAVGLKDKKAKGPDVGGIKTVRLPAMLKPYWDEKAYQEYREKAAATLENDEDRARVVRKLSKIGFSDNYGENIFEEVARFAANVLSLAHTVQFDLIHAHDWMTYPAGVALAQLTGKPLIVHVHSLEYDRAGRSVNPHINQIEAYGVTSAAAVIAVSHYTRSIINKVHGVPLERIFVVHNGIYPRDVVEHYRSGKEFGSKVVLFLGRVTFQKGPDYFVDAAAKVVPHVPDVKFVVAGSGDMLPQLVERVNRLGIRDYFIFTGFLKEREVERIFSIADLYVMPSVSEPFGISALEAVNFDTPALISRQSGVAEVIGHTLKFDFWDVDRLADLIINGLLHDELRADMVAMAKTELRKLRWDQSAARVAQVYRHVVKS